MKRKLIILSIFFVALLAVSTVSAADNATNDIASATDEVASVEEVILSDNDAGTFDALQIEINMAAEGSVLNLTRDYNGHKDGVVWLNKDLTIDGQGHTINCLGDDCSAFYSDAGTITLKNLKIINGHNDDNYKGGAIYIGNSAQYTIINCTFNNNWADDYGGAIYNGANPLTIINCSFNDNEVDDDDGGAIYSAGYLNIENTIFSSNRAYDYGGAIYCERSASLENCLFEKNHANDYGGAIYSNSEDQTMDVINCTFKSNTAGDDDGGAIYAKGSVNVVDSNFTENKALVDGGAIYSKKHVSVKNSTFTSNAASGAVSSSSRGGAICSESLYLKDSSFSKNSADNFGGAICVESSTQQLNVINCNFVENRVGGASIASSPSGGAISASCPMNVEDSFFSKNTATHNGGAINNPNAISVKKSVFISNSAQKDDDDYGRGGAIMSGSLTLYNSTFKSNYAGLGGAINTGALTWIASYSFFQDNRAYGSHGGAISAGKIVNNVEYGIFTNNKAYKDEDSSGGAIAISDESDITFLHCTFTNNFAEKEGGAIFFDDGSSDVTLINNSFVNNTANKAGHDVSNDGNYVKIENNWWGTSSPDFSKGLVVKYIATNHYRNFNDTNPLKEAPAYENLYSNLISDIGPGGNITLADFITCYRYDYGGPINITKSGTIDGSGAIIDMAGSDIQVFNITAPNVTIKNLIIKNANYQGNGSAICFNGVSGTVYDCIFINNTAGVSGGALYFDGDSATVYYCLFINNTAGVSGDAIYFDGCSSTVEKSVFQNTAVNGNEIYFKDCINSNVTCNAFSNQANVITTTNPININDNWWGTNNPEWNTLISGTERPSTFAVLNLTADKQIMNTTLKSKLDYTFYWNGTSDIADIAPTKIELSSNGGRLKDKSGYLINGEFSTEFSSPTAGDYVITARVGNQEINISIRVEGGSYSGLTAEIGQGRNITLQYAYYGYDYGGTISITESCTIDGNGAVVDMINSNIRVFKIAADNVTIKNLIIENANYPGNGGAIYFNKKSVTLQNCTFINNAATSGGAIYSDGVGTVVNCTFENNYAKNHGGAIYYNGIGSVVNCNFIENDGAPGGAIYSRGSVNVMNSNFARNRARGSGAAVCLGDNSFLNNCTFENNDATGIGGAVHMGGEIHNSTFVNNTASNDRGGAVYFNKDGKVVNCTFENNNAPRFASAIYFEVNGDVSDCSFVNHSAKISGGAIYFNQNANVSNSSFVDSTVSEENGGAIYIILSANIFNCSFVNSKAENGGAIYFESIDYTMKSGIIDKCYFANNSANASGGAVHFTDTYTPTSAVISNSYFANNNANAPGGAVNMINGDIYNSSFVNNAANGTGGAINMANGDIDNSYFANNNANGPGGAIKMTNGDMHNCSFVNNTANGPGGAVNMANGEIHDSYFANNNANGTGGAINMAQSKVHNSSFINNTANGSGGAINMANGEIHDSYFANNNANGTGGAVNTAHGDVKNSYFANNNAKVSGGAVNMVNGDVKNSYFANNNANVSGGAIFIKLGESSLDSSFVNNTALYGGAIYINRGGCCPCAFCDGDTTPINIHSSFVNNTAFVGGAIYINNAEACDCGSPVCIGCEEGVEYTRVSVKYSSFVNNTAYDGGAIHSDILFTPNDSWWGVNDPEWNSLLIGGLCLIPSSYAVLDVTADPQVINYNSKSELKYAFYAVGTKTIMNIPTRAIELSTDSEYGKLENESGYLINGIFSTEFSSFYAGDYVITAKVDNQEINITVPVTGGTISGLRAEINSGGEYITLKYPTYTYDYGATIQISRSCTIDGNGAVVDMAGSNIQVFTINSRNVTIKNLIIKNADYGSAGSVIYGFGDLINCTFINNVAKSNGGVAFFMGSSNVINCTFINNSASKNGGAIYYIAKSQANIVNCTFINNSASNGGAMYFDGDSSTVYDCLFINNTAGVSGGAIYFDENSNTVENSIFQNTAVNGNDIYLKDCTNSNITYNAFTNQANVITTTNPININNNWWGTNNPEWNALISGTEKPLTFAVLNVTADKQNITTYFDSKSKLNYTLHWNGTADIANIPTRNIELTSTGGELKDKTGYLINAEFSTEFKSPTAGEYVITAKVDNQEISIAITVEGGSYSALTAEIGQGKNITLQYAYYVYDYGGTINITESCTIDGNGAVIDMANSNIQVFNITAPNVTIKNLIIKNANYQGNGSAIYFNGSSATVYDCIFVNNTAGVSGGAIYFDGSSATVYDCIFVNNTAGVSGGAIYFDGCSSTVENSIFQNIAVNGNDIYLKDSNSNVTYNAFTNQANVITTTNPININNNWWGTNNPEWNTLISGTEKPLTFAVLNVTADKQNITTDSQSKSILNYTLYWNGTADIANIPTRYITLSATGGELKDKSGYLINAEFSTEFKSPTEGEYVITAKVDNQEINITITVEQGKFSGLRAEINSGGENITLKYPTYIYDFGDTIQISKSCTIDGNGAVIDMMGSNIQVFKINRGNVVFKNLIIKNANYSDYPGGSVIYGFADLINCTFINNTASKNGGAIFFTSTSNVINCTFINNSASRGGAIYYYSAAPANIVNCTFINNSASKGGAIYLEGSGNMNSIISNSTFLNNSADSEQITITEEDYQIKIVFKGNNNLLNAIYSNHDIAFTNVTYWGANGIENTGNTPVILVRSENEAGQTIITYLWVDGEEIVYYTIDVTDINGTIILDYPGGIQGNYTILAYHEGDSYYSEIYNYTTNATTGDVAIIIDDISVMEDQNATLTVKILPDTVTGNVTIVDVAGANITVDVTNGTAEFILPVLPVGNYTFNVIYSGDALFNNATSTVNITVNPKTVLTIDADDLTTTYNSGESLIATIKDGNAPIAGISVSININGEIKDNLTTDSNGQINIQLTDLAACNTAYTVNLTINTEYYKANKTVKVTINKATPTIIVGDISLLYNETRNIDAHSYDGAVLNYGDIVNATVIEINGDEVKGLMKGTASFTVSVDETENYTANSVVVNVTVSPADVELNINPSDVTILVNDVYDVSKNVTVEPVIPLTYTVDKMDILGLDGTIVTGLNAGTATVTVTAGDDIHYVKKSANMIITVKLIPTQVSVENATLDLVVDDNFTIVATTVPSGLDVTYVPDDSSVVSVDENGVVTALKAGTATITVKVGGDGVYAENSTTVTVTVIKANVTLSIESSDVVYPNDVVVTIKSDVSGNYSLFLDTTSPQYIILEAGIAKDVTFKGLDAGTYEFTIALPESDKYNAARESVNVTVDKANTTLKVSALDTEYPNSVYGWVVTDCNDTIKLYVSNGMELNITVDTVEIFRLGVLNVGEYNITAVFDGNKNYNNASSTCSFNVTKGNFTFVIWTNGTSFKYNNPIVVHHSLTEGATGTIKYYLQNGTFLGEGDVSENFNLPVLDCGEYLIIGNYSGDHHYSSAISILNITIEKAPNTVVVTVEDTTYGKDALITVTADVDGSYLVDIDGVVYDIDVDGGLGFKSIGLDAGNYSTKTTFDSDNYDTKTTEADFEVKKANNNIEIVVDDSTYGLPYSFYILCDFDGEYTANINDVPVIITVIDGIGHYDAGIIDAGDYNVSIDYPGDKNINPFNASASFTIFKADVNVTITAVDVTYPGDVVVTIESDVSGNYSLFIGTSSPQYIILEAGVAKDVTFDGLNAGTYEFTVALPESDNYNAARKSTNATVAKANVTMSITAVDVTYPGDVVVTIESDVSGNYSLFIGTSSPQYIILEAGVAKDVTFDGLNAGTYEFTIALPESDNYNAARKSTNATVAKANVTMSITAVDVTYPGDVVVTIESDVSGNYSLFIGTSSPQYIILEAGVAKDVTFDGLNAGTYEFTIALPESDNYNAARKSTNATVAKANVTMSITGSNVTYPEDIVLTLLSDLSGNYSLQLGTTTPQNVVLEAGVAKNITFSGFDAGTYRFALAYFESDNYNIARETVIVTVNKVENTTISVEVDSPVAGENATVTVTLPSDATGTVNVKYGNGVYKAPVIDGTAVVSVPTTIAGTETASVTYSGDTNYDSASAEVNITVKVQGVIIAENMRRGVNSSYDYYATLVNAEGLPISDVEITFTIDGKTYKATTNASGIAAISAGLEVVDGKDTVYNVTVTNPYTQENTTATTTIVPRLIVVSGDLTADYLENPPYIVQAIGDDGEHVGANVTVRIVFAGFYYDLQTNETGHVVRTIGLAPGTYAVRGEYLGYKTEQTPFKVLQILQASSGTIKKTAKKYTLKATLRHTDGRRIAGAVVKLNFNGKTYTVKTDSKGVASYTIKSSVINKLKAGKTYVLKAKYVDDWTRGHWQGKIKVVKK